MSITKWIQRNPFQCVIVAGIAASTAMSSGNINQSFNSVGQVRLLTQNNAMHQMELQASEQAKQQSAKVAESRYTSGCVMVVAERARDKFTALSNGQPVIDFARKIPFPVGTIACDAYGNTGEIVADPSGKPVVGRMAFTGNRAVIDAAMKRVNARYQVPQQ